MIASGSSPFPESPWLSTPHTTAVANDRGAELARGTEASRADEVRCRRVLDLRSSNRTEARCYTSRNRGASCTGSSASTCFSSSPWRRSPLSRALSLSSADEIFPPEEFAARRTKLFDRIGDAVAVVLGTPGPPGEMPFRQNSQFFYLTGVTEPHASVIIDGRRATMLSG